MLREDGTGAIEYFYGKMGEVTKTRRTLIVPNQAIATYVTQWTYDSHNRLLEMIYPDEDKITYSYNLGGQLEKVHGYKSYGYDYVSKIGYDKFEQRTYITEQLQIISHSRGSAFLFSTSTSKAFWMEKQQLLDVLVGLHGFLALALQSAGTRIPKRWSARQLAGELRHSPVHRDASHDGSFSVLVQSALF